MSEISNTKRMQRCRHFDYCNAVKCPLDALMHRRIRLPKDKEKCRLSRNKRIVLGRDMKTCGLFLIEIAVFKRVHGSLENAIRANLKQKLKMKNNPKIKVMGKTMQKIEV